MQIIHGKTGWLEVICGPMFSGKSEELIKRLRRAQIAKRRVQIFKHAIDARYDETKIVSHSRQSMPGVAVSDVRDILALVDDRTELVAIDEGQFFSAEIVDVANTLANRGKRVIVAGLDLDYLGQPFGPMPQLLCSAEYVTKQLAICMTCGDPANFTQRLTGATEQVVVGAAETYEARCRLHFEPPHEAVREEAEGAHAPVTNDGPGAREAPGADPHR
jgi:thymidine kinase